MPVLPFGLLAAALLVFLLSTRQFPLLWRTLIWLGGLALLGISAWLVLSDRSHTGLFAVLGDFFTHLNDPGDSLLVRALGGNWPTVGAAIGPMFDAFLILAAVIAGVALLAFTPGEGVERAERPVNIALLGAIGGGLLALAIAGVGFGGAAKRKIYLNVVTAADVIDGDTIRMGDVALRLWGIDAPEGDQICINPENTAVRCGEAARAHLVGLVENRMLACGPPAPRLSSGAGEDLPDLNETSGRPIVVCRTRAGSVDTDIAQAMARDGYAHLYQDANGVKSVYADDFSAAIGARRGLLNRELLPPYLWRNDPAEKCSFVARIEAGVVPEALRAQIARLHDACKGFQAPANDNLPAAPPAPSPT